MDTPEPARAALVHQRFETPNLNTLSRVLIGLKQLDTPKPPTRERRKTSAHSTPTRACTRQDPYSLH